MRKTIDKPLKTFYNVVNTPYGDVINNMRVSIMDMKKLVWHVYAVRRDNQECIKSQSFDGYDEAFDYAARLWALRYTLAESAVDVVLDEHTEYGHQPQFIIKTERCHEKGEPITDLPAFTRTCGHCQNCGNQKTYCRVYGAKVSPADVPDCPAWQADAYMYLHPVQNASCELDGYSDSPAE